MEIIVIYFKYIRHINNVKKINNNRAKLNTNNVKLNTNLKYFKKNFNLKLKK